MSLMFSETYDQALLAFVIREAAKVANEKDSWVGRTAVQKNMYFLGVIGVPMNYKFDIYHYGPFCEKILWDIDFLIADGVIENTSKNPEKFSNYKPGMAIEELIDLHKDKIEPLKNKIKEVVKILVPLKPLQLELVATLDYVYRQLKASGITENLKDVVITRFQEIKKDKFSRDEIVTTFDTMVSAKFVGG